MEFGLRVQRHLIAVGVDVGQSDGVLRDVEERLDTIGELVPSREGREDDCTSDAVRLEELDVKLMLVRTVIFSRQYCARAART